MDVEQLIEIEIEVMQAGAIGRPAGVYYWMESRCCVCGRLIGGRWATEPGVSSGFCAEHLVEQQISAAWDLASIDDQIRIERETEAAWREHDRQGAA